MFDSDVLCIERPFAMSPTGNSGMGPTLRERFTVSGVGLSEDR
jgi:hypothetical protein